jgi:4-amino-4-deoxychorismate lyase
MFRLFESIKVFDRKLWNIEYHNARMNKSRYELFRCEDIIDLSDMIRIPNELSNHLFKCRVTYSEKIHDVEFHPYTIKPITKLNVVYDDALFYEYKSEDRREIQKHLCRTDAGDILIVKNGLITDTSFSNVVFSDFTNLFTPATPLLRGTKRAKLLEIGKIREEDIRLADLRNFKCIYLINALIDLDDNVRIPIEKIVL